jgi:hypothetical protein
MKRKLTTSTEDDSPVKKRTTSISSNCTRLNKRKLGNLQLSEDEVTETTERKKRCLRPAVFQYGIDCVEYFDPDSMTLDEALDNKLGLNYF